MIRRAKKLSLNVKTWNGMILIHGTKKLIINAVTHTIRKQSCCDREGGCTKKKMGVISTTLENP
jgi:hypothetical protein